MVKIVDNFLNEKDFKITYKNKKKTAKIIPQNSYEKNEKPFFISIVPWISYKNYYKLSMVTIPSYSNSGTILICKDIST